MNDNESDIPEIHGDNVESEGLPEVALAYIIWWAGCRTRKWPDIRDDLIIEATLRARDPEERAIVNFYQKEYVGTPNHKLAEQRLCTIVNSSYDDVTGRKRKSRHQEAIEPVLPGLEGQPGPDMGFWMDVKDAFTH